MNALDYVEASMLEKLATRAQHGDERAAAALYDKLVRKVFGFCMSRVTNRSRAEDITQDIFLKLVAGLPSFDQKRGAFVSWFWRLAHNTLVDHLRKPREGVFTDMEEDESDAFEPAVSEDGGAENTLDAKLAYHEIAGLVATFSPEDQELFQLRFVADLSYQEMGGILGRPEGALRVAASRLKKKIKDRLQQS